MDAQNLKITIIVTTSDNYHHCLPVFFKQYAKFWNEPFELVGYKKPDIKLPENCTWVSLGEQRGPQYFTDDLKPYFEKQPVCFVWMMEDSFIKTPVDSARVERLSYSIIKQMPFLDRPQIGKVCLTNESIGRPHQKADGLFYVAQEADYRLSSQPAIWNRDFLVESMKPGLTPWKWETQNPKNDGWYIFGPIENVIEHNEGVRKNNIRELNLEGL